MSVKFFFRCAFVALMLLSPLLFFSSCGNSETVNASTKLVSTTLSGARNVRAARATLETGTSTCGSGNEACITPDEVNGKAYYAGMIVGATNGLSLGPLIGSVEDASKATAFAESELLAFDFGEQLAMTGAPSIGGPIPYPADADAVVREFHVYFGYVDVTFTLAAGGSISALAGTHVLRQVMADITGTDMKKGDIMHRMESETDFKWCVTGSPGNCSQTTRPASPLQNSEIASFSQTEEGNKTIPSFFFKQPAAAETIYIKKSDLTNPASTNTFTVDITMTRGLKFVATPASWSDNVAAMAASFRLPADPGDDEAGFTATITYTP